MSEAVQRVEGGCHCGRIRFAVALRERVLWNCNCSVCTKKGILHLIVEPEDFDILCGESELSTYRFGTGVACHMFCAHCGIHPFYKPRSHPRGWDVNARCLDRFDELSFEIRSFDGRNWERNVDALRDETGGR